VALVAGAAAGRGPPLKLHASAWRLATPGKRRWIAVEFAAIVAWLAAAWFLLEVSCLWWHATAMAVGTALFVDPQAPIHICEGIAAYLNRRGLKSVRELIGKLK